MKEVVLRVKTGARGSGRLIRHVLRDDGSTFCGLVSPICPVPKDDQWLALHACELCQRFAVAQIADRFTERRLSRV